MKSNELYQKEKELSQYKGPDEVVSSRELSETLPPEADKIPTGIPTLDDLHSGGFEAGELVVATGLSGDGKTALLMSITQNMSYEGYKSAWFTLEVTPRQFINKISKNSGDIPLFYLPRENTDNQLTWIENRIIEAKAKYGIQAVFIDHIHQIFSLEKVRVSNLSLEISDLVGKIKQLAIHHNIIVFLIAHCKDDITGAEKEPTMYSIRDSGMINRTADSVVSIWRVPNDHEIDKNRRKEICESDNKSKVRVWKNRRDGKQGSWFMWHENHYLSERKIIRQNDEFGFEI